MDPQGTLGKVRFAHNEKQTARMQVNFIAQPEEQLGQLLTTALDAIPPPNQVVMVSAFASLQAVLRLKERLCNMHSNGTRVRLVVGVDMGGTSKEVLKELASWPIEVFVFKNKKVGVTFHPKIYLIQSEHSAEIFLGSNNLTDGGLYGNYEGVARVSYELPAEVRQLMQAKLQLRKFLRPAPPVARLLDNDYLQVLLQRRDIPDEAESRKRRKEARGPNQSAGPAVEAFGFEPTPAPPQLPLELQRIVLAAVRNQLDELELQRRAERTRVRSAHLKSGQRGVAPVAEIQATDIRTIEPLAQLSPVSFYMELTATSGRSGNIPGEQRVPLEAISAAQEFWGWPENYTESRNPRKGSDRGGEERIYLNWKPTWRLRKADDPTIDVLKDIRMYFYVNSSDFRFYSSDLVKWAKAGDIVELTRTDGEGYDYECVLAVAGTPQHRAWKRLCTQGSVHTNRAFGFA